MWIIRFIIIFIITTLMLWLVPRFVNQVIYQLENYVPRNPDIERMNREYYQMYFELFEKAEGMGMDIDALTQESEITKEDLDALIEKYRDVLPELLRSKENYNKMVTYTNQRGRQGGHTVCILYRPYEDVVVDYIRLYEAVIAAELQMIIEQQADEDYSTHDSNAVSTSYNKTSISYNSINYHYARTFSHAIFAPKLNR